MYLCYLWLLLCSRVTYNDMLQKCNSDFQYLLRCNHLSGIVSADQRSTNHRAAPDAVNSRGRAERLSDARGSRHTSWPEWVSSLHNTVCTLLWCFRLVVLLCSVSPTLQCNAFRDVSRARYIISATFGMLHCYSVTLGMFRFEIEFACYRNIYRRLQRHNKYQCNGADGTD